MDITPLGDLTQKYRIILGHAVYQEGLRKAASKAASKQ